MAPTATECCSGIPRAIIRTLESHVSPWKLCRPAGDFKIYSISQDSNDAASHIAPRSTLHSRSVHDWRSSANYKDAEKYFELAVIPIITGHYASATGLSLGTSTSLERVFDEMKIPIAALSCFLDNRISFIVFPTVENDMVYQLCFRQYSIVWRVDSSYSRTKAILMWMGGSWAKVEIADRVEIFLEDISHGSINQDSPGLLGVLLCSRHVAGSLAGLDHEASNTEKRLRQVIRGEDLKQEDELGQLSAVNSWYASRAIRERARATTALAYIDLLLTEGRTRSPQQGFGTRRVDLESLHSLVKSLAGQALRLCEESSMHLSTIYNLIAQRDQRTNLAIAAASREIAHQSKIDQANSLAIAEASKKIAAESKKDSSTMKIIAIATMIYLPGTFVATCFSMDLFEWTATSSAVVNPRIWVYFLFTGVLTILTVSGFASWTLWQDRYLSSGSIRMRTTTAAVHENFIEPKPEPQMPLPNVKPREQVAVTTSQDQTVAGVSHGNGNDHFELYQLQTSGAKNLQHCSQRTPQGPQTLLPMSDPHTARGRHELPYTTNLVCNPTAVENNLHIIPSGGWISEQIHHVHPQSHSRSHSFDRDFKFRYELEPD